MVAVIAIAQSTRTSVHFRCLAGLFNRDSLLVRMVLCTQVPHLAESATGARFYTVRDMPEDDDWPVHVSFDYMRPLSRYNWSLTTLLCQCSTVTVIACQRQKCAGRFACLCFARV